MLRNLKKLVKNLLSISWVRRLYELSNRAILEIFALNRLFATVYSLFGFITFNREQFAVLRARRDYYRNLSQNRLDHAELRRNIHRLEKGMIMQPRRPVFAKDYITETVEFYEKAVEQSCSKCAIDDSELEWAHDVLERYFVLVDKGNTLVDKAHARFEKTKENYIPNVKEVKAPYIHEDLHKCGITYDEILSLARRRRSVRWFQKKKVPRDLIDKALMVARQSPSACNRLPYEFRVFDDPKMVKKVADIPFGAGGYSHQIPAIIVVTGRLDNYFSPRDRHVVYIDASLAAMSFMFALETLGLSSSVINWPDFEPLEIKMQKALGLDVSERVVMLIAVGYADPKGGIPFSQKKCLNAVRSFNEIAKK